MDARTVGWLLVVGGIGAVAVGVLVMTGALGWFGRLPGDIRIETENTRVFIPITSMIVTSVVLSIAVALARRLL